MNYDGLHRTQGYWTIDSSSFIKLLCGYISSNEWKKCAKKSFHQKCHIDWKLLYLWHWNQFMVECLGKDYYSTLVCHYNPYNNLYIK